MRFYKEVVVPFESDECLMWPYGRNSEGAALMTSSASKSKVPVARMLCEEINGPPPTPKHHAAHECGKGHEGCVNKRHLSWKTAKENAADKIIHGTHVFGEISGRSKLTEAQVKEILSLKGKMTQKQIAKTFGVSRENIGSIHRGNSWGHLRGS